MVSQKGQEAAPFELLIAVILMGFVIVVGIYATTQLEKIKCEQEINKKLEEFKDAVETVATGKGQYSLSFILPRCARDVEIKWVVESDPYICSAVCGGSRAVCVLLRFDATDVKSMVKCLNVSPLTIFVAQKDVGAGVKCPSRCTKEELLYLEEWSAVNITQGEYIVTAGYGAAGAVPVLCAYRKVLPGEGCPPD